MLNQLLQLLSDGDFHSGEALGASLGVSRAAVWKHIRKLDELGIPYSSIKGKGYRLPSAIELLDADKIRTQLDGRLDVFEVLLSVDSTNTYLFDRAASLMGQRCVVMAEQQLAGRGRRGRQWVSPFGKNIYVSMLSSFNGGLHLLGGLSLVCAIAVRRALTSVGVPNVQVKWPNDVYIGGKKAAGILLEVTGEYNSHCQVVMGIGVNMSLSDDEAQAIEQPWVAVKDICPHVSRHDLSVTLINELLSVVREFEQEGFTPFQHEWSEHDVFHNEAVRVVAPSSSLDGTVYGVNRKGELLLQTDVGMQTITAGELSVRLVD